MVDADVNLEDSSTEHDADLDNTSFNLDEYYDAHVDGNQADTDIDDHDLAHVLSQLSVQENSAAAVADGSATATATDGATATTQTTEAAATTKITKTVTMAAADGTNASSASSMVDYLTNNMDFTLSCEIGQMNVSLNELLNFKQGQSLDFNLNLQQVKIIINNVVLGFGQLVEVDGKYGVKITKILSVVDSIAQ